MADADVKLLVTADTAKARKDLQAVRAEVERVEDAAAVAPNRGASVTGGADAANAPVIDANSRALDRQAAAAQRAGMRMTGLASNAATLSNGLRALGSGRGGLGALLQTGAAAGRLGLGIKAAAGAALAVKGAMVGAFAAVGVAAGAAAAEVRKNQVGVEAWRKESVGAVKTVGEWWGNLKSKILTPLNDWWKGTAIGSFFDAWGDQKREAGIAQMKSDIDEQHRLGGLTGDALAAEITRQEEVVMSDASSSAERAKAQQLIAALYDKQQQERAAETRRREDEAAEVENLQNAGVKQSDADRDAIERREKFNNTLAAIAGRQLDSGEVNRSQMQSLARLGELLGRRVTTPSRLVETDFAPEEGRWVRRTNRIPEAIDQSVDRDVTNRLRNLQRSGVPLETVLAYATGGVDVPGAAATGRTGLDLEDAISRLPRDIVSEMNARLESEPVTWGK